VSGDDDMLRVKEKKEENVLEVRMGRRKVG
jgi:hypothetical protein